MYTKQFIRLLLIGVSMVSFSSCSKDDDTGGGSGGGDKNTPTELTRADFESDLILEDRNEGVDYRVIENIDISNAFEIRPGVVIEFDEGTGLDVRETGTITAVGLEDKPIVFTGSIKSKGAWLGVIVESQSLKNQFKYCQFSYAGGETWGNEIQGGLTTWARASLNIDDCTFRDNKVYGVQFYDSRENDIRSFENNSFENNDKAILVHSANVHQLGRGNSFVGNDPTIDIYAGATFEFLSSGASLTWKTHDIAYRVLGRVDIDGNNVTLEKGIRMLFDESAYLYVRDKGSLTAIGTVDEPIYFGGVINTSGSWPGVAYRGTESIKNELSHVIIEHGGNGNDDFEKGVIWMWADPVLKVSNCTFKNIPTCIFNHASSGSENPNLTQENNEYQNTGDEHCI